MELWTMWTQMLEAALAFLTAYFGFSEAVAIVFLTLMARITMMPLSLKAAYNMQRNREVMERIKPALEKLRNKLKHNPHELAARTMALYRENGIVFIGKISLLNIGFQSIFGMGMFQVLKRMVFRSKFFWISNLGKPDFLLTIITGLLMAMAMMLMPGSTENTSMLYMVAIPVLITVVAVAMLPSALGLYWATSNVVTIGQSLALRAFLARRHRLQNRTAISYLKK
jgi:YidC/Oxa1 family membrane protein insertase